ncbi:flavocytochrome c [Aquicoccus sp. SU-CL01552]|uniref:flavocytochrome c n=1 Tax=Aquicoccus sp. SU-CL01552 TaxID=3127656 RepID=UPI003102B494
MDATLARTVTNLSKAVGKAMLGPDNAGKRGSGETLPIQAGLRNPFDHQKPLPADGIPGDNQAIPTNGNVRIDIRQSEHIGSRQSGVVKSGLMSTRLRAGAVRPLVRKHNFHVASGDMEFTMSQSETRMGNGTAVPEKWDEDTDVVVIGSGFAGLAAAIEIADTGASVKVIEKMDKPGGNSMINGGQVAAAASQWQEKQGVKDSPELMLKDMLAAGLDLNMVELARTVAEKSSETVNWTVERLGAEYADRVNILGGHSVARTLQTKNGHGSEIVNRQVAALEKLGVKIEYNRQLTRLLQDADGVTQGICIRDGYIHPETDSGTEKYIRAKKAVVLCSGGFSRDLHFRTIQDPRLTDAFDSTNHPGATAEGLKSALKVGAAPVQLSWIQLGPWASPDEEGMGTGPGFAGGSAFPYGIMVDPSTGKRYVNELADRKIRADAELKIGHPSVAICDQYGTKFIWWGLEKDLKNGVVKKFDTLAELAADYDIPADALAATVERYNGFVSNRHDEEFGKTFLDNVRPITEPPFYAMHVWPKIHHTMGGIEINSKAQVVDLDGNVIPRLYAAGEVVGGVHGASRLGSVAIIDCLVFGRVAGQNAAAES